MAVDPDLLGNLKNVDWLGLLQLCIQLPFSLITLHLSGGLVLSA